MISMSDEYQFKFIFFRMNVSKCWGKDTSFKNVSDGSSIGQCYVTSLLASKMLGGSIMHGWVKTVKGGREHHFWNRIGNFEYDFTSDQYGGDGMNPIVKGEIYMINLITITKNF